MTTEKRNLVLAFMGNLVSLFGSAIYTFAMGLYVLKLTGSGVSFAVNLVMGILPIIVINPFAGVIADRFDKKRTVVLMDLLSAILLLGLYGITRTSSLSLPLIYGSTLVLTSLTQVLGITFEAAKPNLVGREIPVVRLNSLTQVVYGVTAILGPVVGGMVFALVDIRAFILINGLSFGLSALSECFIDFKFNGSQVIPEEKLQVFREIREGIRYLRSRQDLMDYIGLFVLGNFFISAAVSVGLPVLITVELGMSSQTYGLIQGVFPVGLIVGAIFVEKVSNRVPMKRLVFMSMFLAAVLILLLGLPVLLSVGTDWLLIGYFMGIAVAFGVAITFVDVPTMTYTQTEVEEAFRGRVMSIRISLVKIVNPIAFLLSGLLIGKVSAAAVMVGCGVLFMLYLLIFKRGFVFGNESLVEQGKESMIAQRS